MNNQSRSIDQRDTIKAPEKSPIRRTSPLDRLFSEYEAANPSNRTESSDVPTEAEEELLASDEDIQ